MVDDTTFRCTRQGKDMKLRNTLELRDTKLYNIHPIFQKLTYHYGKPTRFLVDLPSRDFDIKKHAVFNDAATNPPLRRLGTISCNLSGVIRLGISRNSGGVTVGQVLRRCSKFLEGLPALVCVARRE